MTMEPADIARLRGLSPVDRIRDLTPILEEAAAEIGQLTGPQRVAFALQLIRDIEDTSCAGGLIRLARLAEERSHTLLKRQFDIEAG